MIQGSTDLDLFLNACSFMTGWGLGGGGVEGEKEEEVGWGKVLSLLAWQSTHQSKSPHLAVVAVMLPISKNSHRLEERGEGK